MIYLTGDTHIPVDIGKLSTKRFPEQKALTPNDYLIICGDFGGVWNGGNEDKYWIKWLDSKRFTTLFIDGNHENFDMLSAFPTVELGGGRAHKISDSIYHLMRGEIFELDGKKIFTLGGASSHDAEYRKEGVNWWRDELPTVRELEYAFQQLDKHNWSVDYIVTHCAPASIQRRLAPHYGENPLTAALEKIKDKASYTGWFFGHYHIDTKIDDKHTALYSSIIRI